MTHTAHRTTHTAGRRTPTHSNRSPEWLRWPKNLYEKKNLYLIEKKPFVLWLGCVCVWRMTLAVLTLPGYCSSPLEGLLLAPPHLPTSTTWNYSSCKSQSTVMVHVISFYNIRCILRRILLILDMVPRLFFIRIDLLISLKFLWFLEKFLYYML